MSDNVRITYFSGYIRNWKSLCGELGLSTDLSREDRENSILVKGYERWGMELIERMYGAFAFVIRDEQKGIEFVARDYVGQKQMFYTVSGGELYCSGDIDEVVSRSGIEKRLNKAMLQQYLFYGYPIGDQTFYEGVYKLLPGHYLEWNGAELKDHTYFKPFFTPDRSKSPEEFAEEIKAVVEEILGEEREDKEVPYKESFLSGGVDSSYLLAAGDAARANTVGYVEEGFDESKLARHTAEILGREFGVRMIGPEEYFARIPDVIKGMGQPLGDASAVAFSLGCASVAERCRVVYSGEGIDEFFGGYNAHKRVLDPSWTYLTCSHIMNKDVVRSLMRDYDDSINPEDPIADLWAELKGYDPLAQKLTVDISLWLEGDIYLNTDRTSTACGIELHTPFSDQRLFNVARRIPAEYQFKGEYNKYVFRLAASSKLPDEVAFRKKVGFAVPVSKWIADAQYNGDVKAKLFGDSSAELFDRDYLSDMWDAFMNGDGKLWNRIYAIYAFLLWYDLKFKA